MGGGRGRYGTYTHTYMGAWQGVSAKIDRKRIKAL